MGRGSSRKAGIRLALRANVARQCRPGRIENCQVGVFFGYASLKRHALIAWRLYAPKHWAADDGALLDSAKPLEVCEHRCGGIGRRDGGS
jgi:hypothetical protein